MRVLVTGHDGFVGKHVGQILSILPFVDEKNEKVELRDESSILRAVESIQPEAVLHLASQSYVPLSLENPLLTLEVNFLGTFYLLNALRKIGFSGKFIFVGSGDEYGSVEENKLPIREYYPLKPRNPYAVSKVAGEALCYQNSQEGKFQVILARPFNHFGPGQSEEFVLSNFAKQIVEIKAGIRKPVIEVGNVDVTRDFTDVRDVVRAYLLLLEKGKNGEVYNVCSGREWKIRALLEKLLRFGGIDVEIRTATAKLRKTEQIRVFGSYEKLNRETGWEPNISMEQSLRDILLDWERRIS